MARILIIDDEKSIRLSLSELLTGCGYEVLTAAGSDEALETVNKLGFDIVITDIILPKLNGIVLIKQILEIQPDIEVIFISGEPNLSTASEAVRMGAFDYLAKPIPFDVLKRTVAKAINVKQLSDEKKRLEIENRHYRDHLEKLVKKRTKKLSDTNKILRDAIDQKIDIEKKLQSSQKQLSLIIDNLPAMVAYIDADGNYRFVNKSYSDYFKIPQKIDGKVNITSIFSERTYKKVKPYIDKVLEGKKVKFNDDTTLKNGEKRHFHTEYIPQFDESGKVIAYVILRQDMTGYHRMKDANFQAERYKSLSNMASGIANEYNNMLTVCLGNITLAKSVEDIPTSVYNRLLRMENAVYNAKELTQQLISFSQNADSWRDTFHLSEVLKSAITFIKKKMDSTCELNLTSETMKVQVNISQIIHVIHTIVNALVEKEPQNGTIYIVAKSKEVTTASYLPLKSGTYTTISISAKLPEFPSSGIPQIFSPFSKSENIKDSMRIATVYSIIQDHHGYLSVDHQNGSDTIFTLYIPMSKSDSHSDEIRKHVQARGDNAIVMDDEENVGRVISDMLKHLGFNVTFLKEGNSVIDTYKKALDDARSYDLVLLDLFIPNGMGAKETNQKLIEIDPNIKSIIMSGFHDDPIMLNYSDYGFAGYLKKPFEIKQLESTIATVL